MTTTGENGGTIDAFLMSTPIGGSAEGIISALGAAVQFTKQIVSEFEQMFGIGAGRREADVITPYQNQFGQILASAVSLMADPNYNRDPVALQAIYSIIYNAYQAFDVKLCGYPTFSQWPDGRAARQAHADFGSGGKFFDTPAFLASIKQKFYEAGGEALVVQRDFNPAGGVGSMLGNDLLQLAAIKNGDSPTGAFTGRFGSSSNSNLLLFGGLALLAVLALRES
jgi:hypothetical protein